jgi:hypothetical protein
LNDSFNLNEILLRMMVVIVRLLLDHLLYLLDLLRFSVIMALLTPSKPGLIESPCASAS